MKTLRSACFVLLLTGVVSAAAAHAAVAVAVGASVGGPVGVDFFYNHLSPYGHWAQRPNYGWVWLPGQVNTAWRPYSAGRWVYTDYGWTWDAAASEPWGWATYHYGRWYNDPEYGWGWVPGTDWGPSWVSWQQGGGYLGWAPLPPAVGWNASVGLELGGFNLGVGIAPASYCFVPERSFLAANVGGFILPSARNVAIFHGTTNITNYSVVNHQMFNRSLQVANVQRFTGQSVHQYRLANMSEANRAGRLSGTSLAMFHPAIERRANTPTPREVAPRSVVSSPSEAHRAVVAQGQPADRRANALAAEHRAAPAPASRAVHQNAAVHHAPPATARSEHHAPATDAHHQAAASTARTNEERQASVNREHQAAASHEHAAAASQERQAALNRQHEATANRQHQAAAASRQRQAAASHQQRQTAVTHQHTPPAAATANHRAPATGGEQHRSASASSEHRAPQAAAAQHHQAPPPQQHAQAAHNAPPPKANHEGGGEHRQAGRR
jgi:hypothetical protein